MDLQNCLELKNLSFHNNLEQKFNFQNKIYLENSVD